LRNGESVAVEALRNRVRSILAFKGLGIAFVTAGLLSLAFLGFSGMISI